MDADYTAWASAVAAFSAVVCWTNHLIIVIMANAYRNTDLSLAMFRPVRTGRRFTARIGNLFLVLRKCNIWIYFLLLYSSRFFGTTFYFLESKKKFTLLLLFKSRIFGMYFYFLYFLESSKVIYFWQHCSIIMSHFFGVFKTLPLCQTLSRVWLTPSWVMITRPYAIVVFV